MDSSLIAQINTLSPAELERLIEEASRVKQVKYREGRMHMRRRLIDLAATEGYTVEELFGIPKGMLPPAERKAADAKFRNPENPAQSWPGRGKRPRWLQEAIAAGARLESFRVR
jgi:DNA-binding protein H-NS